MFRHGQKDDDALTPFGVRQVVASTREHLDERRIHPVAYHSGKCRAEETAREAMKAFGFDEPELVADPRFDVWWVMDEQWPQYDYETLEPELAVEGTTLYDLMEKWPPAWAIRMQIQDAILYAASEADEGSTVVVGHHGWCCETAFPGDPREAMLMDMGDIYLYAIEVDVSSPYSLRIAGVEHLRCPLPITADD